MVFNVEYVEKDVTTSGYGLIVSIKHKKIMETTDSQRLKDIIFNKTQLLLYTMTSNQFKASKYVEFEKFLDELIDGLEYGRSEEWCIRGTTFRVERIR